MNASIGICGFWGTSNQHMIKLTRAMHRPFRW